LYTGNATYFYHRDHLGSTRLGTDLTGHVSGTNYDFLPFGEQIAGTNATYIKFTGNERDSESGLDNFGARYNSSSLGRFMSPDPENAGASLDSPQSWNAYSYVLNNPLNAVDPSGLVCVWSDGSYDATDDPETGSREQCENDYNGGVWIDDKMGGNWSDQPDESLALTYQNVLDFENGADPSIQITVWDGALNPYATAVLGGVVNDISGPPSYRACEAQVASGFNNNWFIKNFSLGSLGRDPTPFAKTTAEALATKGGGTALAYGGGDALRYQGLKTMRSMGSFEPEWYIGKGMIKAGSALKGGALFGVKALGTAGTVATVGATTADFGYSQYASYQCRGYLHP
jgi:RHS repeat-associated protein